MFWVSPIQKCEEAEIQSDWQIFWLKLKNELVLHNYKKNIFSGGVLDYFLKMIVSVWM